MATTTADRRTERLLLYGLTGGVAWWLLHLCGVAALAPAACGGAGTWPLNALTVVCALGALSAVVVASRVRRRPAPASDATERTSGLAFLALLVNAASLLLVLMEGLPVLVLTPCQ